SSFLLLSFSIILPYLIVDLKLCNRTVQNDGTVAVTGNDGKMKVLPQTGEKETIALSIAGIFMILTGGFSLFRLNKRDRAKS
ncbi:LPXTG cell wall anchor domain-containing protein, partial [Enterococcus gallinarum]|uniref:LPXTG cell wall anchor domain-containing protein n=1 Tax=Enterococcus gallinarum TaxID=1353 RepID=UPI00288EAF61